MNSARAQDSPPSVLTTLSVTSVSPDHAAPAIVYNVFGASVS